MLAALLGWGQGTFASKIEIGAGTIEVTREVDGGAQTLALKTARRRDDRFASERAALRLLPNIMKAKKKPIADKTAADYGVDLAPRLKVLKTVEPAGPQGGHQGRRASPNSSASSRTRRV